jgi:SpoU rRNA methylase family enzyme
LKTIYAVPGLIPVIIKPYGAAAQVGVPEAYKISYKLSKPLVILPEIRDLIDVLACNYVYYFDESGVLTSLDSIISSSEKKAVIISSGEQEISNINVVWPSEIPRGVPSLAIAGILVYELVKGCKIKN